MHYIVELLIPVARLLSKRNTSCHVKKKKKMTGWLPKTILRVYMCKKKNWLNVDDPYKISLR